MPPVPPEQSAEYSAPPPRGPHDHDTQPAVQRDDQSGEAASSAAVEALTPEQRRAARIVKAARRRALPVLVRYDDLVAAGIALNWTTLLRLIDEDGFPVGVMIGRNTRAWRADEVEAWLASRPMARKVIPPDAVHPRVRDKRAAVEAAAAR